MKCNKPQKKKKNPRNPSLPIWPTGVPLIYPQRRRRLGDSLLIYGFKFGRRKYLFLDGIDLFSSHTCLLRLYFLLKQQLIKVQMKKILNLCASTCCSSRLDLDFSEDFHNHSFTAVSLSGISKLPKFEIFQASNSLFVLLVDFLDQKLSITHSHQLGLLSGSGFITWQTEIGGYDFVEILQWAVCYAFSEFSTHVWACLWKQMSPKWCNRKHLNTFCSNLYSILTGNRYYLNNLFSFKGFMTLN